jgi:hypothetical protein
MELADGQTRLYFTDNRKQQVSTDLGKLTNRARWKKNNQLVVRSSRSDGPEIMQTFDMEHDGARLTVITRLEGQGPAVTFRRVYERAEAAEPE